MAGLAGMSSNSADKRSAEIVRAGAVSAQYAAGSLRYLRAGRRELLRQIYVAVRDSHWGTIPAQIFNKSIECGAGWFRITFVASHRLGEIDFSWEGEIEGDD